MLCYRTAFVLALPLYGLLIAYLSLSSTGNGPGLVPPWDKVAHASAYGVFAVIALGAAGNWRRYVALCVGIVFYGIALEIAQSALAARDMSMADAAMNALGVVLVALVARQRFRALETN